jgi:hypothetical protein
MRSLIVTTAIATLLGVCAMPMPADAQDPSRESPERATPDRMPPIPADKLTAAQHKAIEEFKAARSADITGPFIPLLRSPEVMTRARAMGDYLRSRARCRRGSASSSSC